jgi:hypothetical protein
MDVRDRLAANMRHLMFLKAGALEFQEAPDPKIENARQALVRPLAVAACDLDSHIVAGRAPFRGRWTKSTKPAGEHFYLNMEEMDAVVKALP